jgi:hypothetical protein
MKSVTPWENANAEAAVQQVYLSILNLKAGASTMPTNDSGKACLFIGSMAYVVPPGYAESLLAAFRNSASYRSPDVWMHREGHIAALWWPNPFVDKPSESTTGTKDQDTHCDPYHTGGYRKKARSLGLPLPSDEARVADIVNWQLHALQKIVRGVRHCRFYAFYSIRRASARSYAGPCGILLVWVSGVVC